MGDRAGDASVWLTYMIAAMAASRTGTPRPTLTPIMTALLTRCFSDSSPDVSEPFGDDDEAVVVGGGGGGGGVYDFGFPDELVIVTASAGKSTFWKVDVGPADQTTGAPDATLDVSVFVITFLVRLCSEAGQLIRPGEAQTVAV